MNEWMKFFGPLTSEVIYGADLARKSNRTESYNCWSKWMNGKVSFNKGFWLRGKLSVSVKIGMYSDIGTWLENWYEFSGLTPRKLCKYKLII